MYYSIGIAHDQYLSTPDETCACGAGNPTFDRCCLCGHEICPECWEWISDKQDMVCSACSGKASALIEAAEDVPSIILDTLYELLHSVLSAPSEAVLVAMEDMIRGMEN
jgi:hypothetical protein